MQQALSQVCLFGLQMRFLRVSVSRSQYNCPIQTINNQKQSYISMLRVDLPVQRLQHSPAPHLRLYLRLVPLRCSRPVFGPARLSSLFSRERRRVGLNLSGWRVWCLLRAPAGRRGLVHWRSGSRCCPSFGEEGRAGLRWTEAIFEVSKSCFGAEN